MNLDDYCFIGVDPGYVNLGYSLTDGECRTLRHGVLSPRQMGITDTVRFISNLVPKHKTPILVLERYVAYEGVHNPNSEDILMLIGALVYEFENKDERVLQFRAIDWKPKLCKILFKQGFRNPANKFDKEYSLAAAKAVSGIDFKTDHEADATCLSHLGYLYVKEQTEKTPEEIEEART